MTVSEVLKEARIERGLTQKQLAEMVYVSQEAIGKAERGLRKSPQCASNQLINVLDNGFLAMELAQERLGYAFVSKLDGENVDLHRASVKDKTIEEVTEAYQGIKQLCLSNVPEYTTEYKKQEIESVLKEAIDAVYALLHYISVCCRDYKISWIKIWSDHRTKLKSRGYVR